MTALEEQLTRALRRLSAQYETEQRRHSGQVCQWPSKSAHFWPSKSAQLASVPAEGAKRPERGPMLGSGRPS